MPSVVGMDPMDIELVNAVLATKSTQSRGGVVRQAIAAIENALLDIKGKALGVPVYQLFGGKLRDRIPVYWSHCGSYRMRNPDICGTPAVRSYDDMARTGEEVRKKGFTACKTNIAMEIDGKLRAYRPGFVVGKVSPSAIGTPSSRAARRRPSRRSVPAPVRMSASCSTPTSISVPKASSASPRRWGPTGLTWLELDIHDPKSIAMIRRDAPCPIASGETLLERRDFRPYLEAYAFDTAIVDVIWNGFAESLKIASHGRRLRSERGAA